MAAAGHCPFCLFNLFLAPDERFRQYPKKLAWQQHLDRHFEELEKKDELALASDEIKTTPCPDPRCGLSFDAVVDLQYHNRTPTVTSGPRLAQASDVAVPIDRV